jgi:glycosyltransferase involved in cell wall biosynthesis/tRNA A-37 threonylcarbamoyl transferase component Bud32
LPDTLTVIVPTFNEEDHIGDCLESAKWADDIFVVDSFSTDRTLDIARGYTDHIVQHEYINSAAQKNWAIPQAKGDWVMVVDADERITPELRVRIQRILSNGTKYDGFYIKRMTIFFGRVIQHGGWHSDYLIRLWRNGKGRYENLEVHADVIVDGNVGVIREYFLHDTYRSMDHFVEKLGRYTTLSANDLYKAGKSATWVNLTLRPLWRFFRMFLLRHGFLDGKHGLILCTFASFNVFLKYAKLWDHRRRDLLGLGNFRRTQKSHRSVSVSYGDPATVDSQPDEEVMASPDIYSGASVDEAIHRSELKVLKTKGLSRDELFNLVVAHHQALDSGEGVLKNGPRAAVTRVRHNDYWLCIKEYRRRSAFDRIKTRLGISPALRAWRGALHLRSKGIETPENVAVAELPGRSYLFTRFLDAAAPLDFLLRERFVEPLTQPETMAKRTLISQLGRWLRHVHDLGVYHDDWSPKNFMASQQDQTWDFTIVDTESVSPRRRLTYRRRVKNLAQLSSARFGVTGSDRMRFLLAYAGQDAALTRGHFPRDIIDATRRRDNEREKLRKKTRKRKANLRRAVRKSKHRRSTIGRSG